MEIETQNFNFWKLVLSISESIASDIEKGQINKNELLTYLATIEEIIGESNDPVADFQKFVLLDLCRSFRKSLSYL